MEKKIRITKKLPRKGDDGYKIVSVRMKEETIEKLDGTKIVCDRCYRALCKIKQILEDDSLDDPECFWRIEEIVNTLEVLGTDGGTRHDFG